jgi:hypothetical protein
MSATTVAPPGGPRTGTPQAMALDPCATLDEQQLPPAGESHSR